MKYYWSRQEEAKLLKLWEKGERDLKVLGKELDRKPEAIEKKLGRLGVVVVREKKIQQTTTTEVKVSRGLLTHEEALKLLAGALNLLRKKGQNKMELQRLRILVHAIQAYDSVLEKFEHWVLLENRLVEMERKIRELQKNQKV